MNEYHVNILPTPPSNLSYLFACDDTGGGALRSPSHLLFSDVSGEIGKATSGNERMDTLDTSLLHMKGHQE